MSIPLCQDPGPAPGEAAHLLWGFEEPLTQAGESVGCMPGLWGSCQPPLLLSPPFYSPPLPEVGARDFPLNFHKTQSQAWRKIAMKAFNPRGQTACGFHHWGYACQFAFSGRRP